MCVEHQNPDLQQFSAGCDDGRISGFMSILFFFFLDSFYTAYGEHLCWDPLMLVLCGKLSYSDFLA